MRSCLVPQIPPLPIPVSAGFVKYVTRAYTAQVLSKDLPQLQPSLSKIVQVHKQQHLAMVDLTLSKNKFLG